MTAVLHSHEQWLRLGAFAGVLGVMALWEMVAPRRRLTLGRRLRWPSNLGVVVVDTLLVRLLFPVTAVGFALICEQRGWGLLNLAGPPGWLALVTAVVLLDLAIYAQHVAFHAVPALWRLHRMHHADLDFDATTGVRFHPVEIILSALIKLALVGLIGAPALAVLVFELLLSATSIFNHGNVRLAPAADLLLRRVLVTPDMHRVHHSVLPAETNSNFGFNLVWWDHLFGTYRAEPAGGHEHMRIGVAGLDDPSEQRLDRMLTQPLRIAS